MVMRTQKCFPDLSSSLTQRVSAVSLNSNVLDSIVLDWVYQMTFECEFRRSNYFVTWVI